MTFGEAFNGSDDTVAKSAIEIWGLKTVRVECRVGTSPLSGLGLRHQQHLASSASPARLGANPKIVDLQPS